MAYWLMKSEPDAYSIDDLKKDRRTCWDGVRNYQARNMMRDDMRKGDQIFFYHSNCKEPGIVGIMKVCQEGYPDMSSIGSFGKPIRSNTDPDNPTWFMVDVQYQRKFKNTVTLQELKSHPELAEMALVRRGNRLSIMPVSAAEWEFVLGLE